MRHRPALGVAALLLAAFTATALTTGAVGAAEPPPDQFSDEFVASFDRATAVEWLPSSQIVVTEQHTGRLKIGSPGGSFSTALDLSVCTANEQGLLGFTHDPAFLGNGLVYVYYTARTPAGACVNRVSRFTLTGSTIDPATELVLLDNVASTGGNHNGGDLDIDRDGNLLVSIGDAGTDPRGDSGSAGNNDAAQDLSLLNGKIVRITRDGSPAPGNPFAGAGTSRCAFSGVGADPTTRCQEIYAYGLRNPFRIAVDRNDGAGRFFINDVGQGTQEEVNDGKAAADYGWPAREGNCPAGQLPPCDGPGANQTDPVTSYSRSLGTFITAGAFVPDGMWPAEYDGGYLFADGGRGNVWLRTADGDVDYDQPFATDAFGLADMTFGYDATGVPVLYYTLTFGGLRMIRPTGVGPAPASSDLALSAVDPFRVYDTGPDAVGVTAGSVFNGTSRLVDLDPPPGTAAALVNITYDATAGPGFVTAWRARTARPATSSLNADRSGSVVANAAIVALDDNGDFVFESSTTGRVVIDVMGWFRTTDGTSAAGRYVALDPLRLADTREPAGAALESGSPNPFVRVGDRVDLDVVGQLGVPGDDTVAAAVISVAAIGRDGSGGFVGGHASGTAWNGTSNVNVLSREVRANMIVVPVGSDGGISLTTFQVDDIAVDLLGYITSDTAVDSGSGLYNTISPTRSVDTRVPLGTGRLAAETPARVSNPAATTGAAAVAQNITVTGTSGAGFVSAHPGPTPPIVSSVNYDGPGQTRAAFAFTTVDDDQQYFTSFVATDLVVDVVGWFTP